MEELPQILDGIKMTTSKQEIEKGTTQFRNVTRICIIILYIYVKTSYRHSDTCLSCNYLSILIRRWQTICF